MLIGALVFGSFCFMSSPVDHTNNNSCPSNACLVLRSSRNSELPTPIVSEMNNNILSQAGDLILSLDFSISNWSNIYSTSADYLGVDDVCPSNTCLVKWSPPKSIISTSTDSEVPTFHLIEPEDVVFHFAEERAFHQVFQREVTCDTNNCLVAGYITQISPTEDLVPQVVCSIPFSVDVDGELSSPLLVLESEAEPLSPKFPTSTITKMYECCFVINRLHGLSG